MLPSRGCSLLRWRASNDGELYCFTTQPSAAHVPFLSLLLRVAHTDCHCLGRRCCSPHTHTNTLISVSLGRLGSPIGVPRQTARKRQVMSVWAAHAPSTHQPLGKSNPLPSTLLLENIHTHVNIHNIHHGRQTCTHTYFDGGAIKKMHYYTVH